MRISTPLTMTVLAALIVPAFAQAQAIGAMSTAPRSNPAITRDMDQSAAPKSPANGTTAPAAPSTSPALQPSASTAASTPSSAPVTPVTKHKKNASTSSTSMTAPASATPDQQ